jgi:hypothetical protein
MTKSVSTACCEPARALAERTGHPAADLDLQVCAGAMMGWLTQAVLHWGEGCDAEGGEGAEHLPEVIERALDVLERGPTL